MQSVLFVLTIQPESISGHVIIIQPHNSGLTVRQTTFNTHAFLLKETVITLLD